MKENWKQIKKDIVENVKDIFENLPTPQYTNVEQAVDLFKKVLSHKTGIKKLDGLNDAISESISDIYNSKPGKTNPVENLLNNIEPFLKKIIFLKTGVNTSEDHTKNLMWCLKELNILTGNKVLSEAKLLTYKGQPNYLEYICKAYIGRNAFHNAPKLKAIEVLQFAESGLVVYIYSILKDFSALKNIVGDVVTDEIHAENYRNYALSVLSYNPTFQMIEGDFGIKMQAFDDFEIKIKAKAKKREEELGDYLKDSSNPTVTPVKFLPEIDGIMGNARYLLLHGIATAGKSTILKKLGKDFLEKYNSPYLFYLELGEIFKKNGKNRPIILNEIKSKYKEIAKSEIDFEKVNEKILILLDGLDEVAEKSDRELIIDQLIEFRKWGNIQIVLTSRTNDYVVNDLKIESYFEKFELLPLNISDIISIGNKILGNGSSYNNFVKIVKKNSLLKAFPKTPLTSILLAILFKEKEINVKELPKNVTELYKKFTDLFLNRWDKTKGIGEQFKIQKKELVLQTIAEHMQNNRLISMPCNDLEKFIKELSEKKPLGGPLDPKEHIKDLCERTNILIKDEYNNTYKFFHLTIQEYLAAMKFDHKSDDKLVENFYEEWWLNPNIFYAGNKTEYPEVLKRVAKFEIYPLDDEQKFNYISHCSKVLLAAHNLDNSVRNEVLKSMIKIFDEFSKMLIKELVDSPEFIDKNHVINTKIAKIKNQTLLTVILSLRDMFIEFFAISDFQKELDIIWQEYVHGKNKLSMSDTTLYSLSYCLAIKSSESKYLEEFVMTNNITINSRWFRIVDVDINVKKLKNSRKKVVLKIKQTAQKNSDYIQKQFKEKINKHYNSITGMLD